MEHDSGSHADVQCYLCNGIFRKKSMFSVKGHLAKCETKSGESRSAFLREFALRDVRDVANKEAAKVARMARLAGRANGEDVDSGTDIDSDYSSDDE